MVFQTFEITRPGLNYPLNTIFRVNCAHRGGVIIIFNRLWPSTDSRSVRSIRSIYTYPYRAGLFPRVSSATETLVFYTFGSSLLSPFVFLNTLVSTFVLIFSHIPSLVSPQTYAATRLSVQKRTLFVTWNTSVNSLRSYVRPSDDLLEKETVSHIRNLICPANIAHPRGYWPWPVLLWLVVSRQTR